MPKTTNIIMLGIGGQGMLTMMEMFAIAAEEARVLSRVSLARLGDPAYVMFALAPRVALLFL